MLVRGWLVAVRILEEFFVVLYKDEEKNSGYGCCFSGGIVMIDSPFECYLLSFKEVGCWV